MPVCKHCGSPARHHPCWYEFTDEGAALHDDLRRNFDPPCMGDSYDNTMDDLRRDRMKDVAIVAGAIGCVALGIAWLLS